MRDVVASLQVEGTYLIVYDTHGAADCKYRSMTVDGIGCGGGDDIETAVRTYANSLRRIADEIEKSFDKGC